MYNFNLIAKRKIKKIELNPPICDQIGIQDWVIDL